MDLQQRMKDLDARIAARKDAIDHKLGLAKTGGPSSPTAATPSATRSEDTPPSSPDVPTAPELKAASAPTGKGTAPAMKKSDFSGKIKKILSDMDNGFDIPGLFTVPGIVVKVLFLLCCLSAILNLFWAIHYCFFYHSPAYGVAYADGYGHSSYWWLFWPVICEAGLAYLLWWLCAKKK